jgi:hypothetical protein
MRKNWFGLLWVCILLASYYAKAQMPYIQFDKTEHDFGNIKEKDGIATCTFNFKNEGKSSLIITQVQASCGCTTPNWSKDSIPPGGKGFVEAAFNPEGRPGPFLKTMTIFSNASISAVNLTIKGVVLEEVPTKADQYPRKLGKLRLLSEYLQMGTLGSNQEVTQVFEIYNDANSTIHLRAESVPASVKVNFMPSKLKKGQSGKLKVTFSAKAHQQWGQISLPFYIRTSSSKADPGELVFVNAQVEDEPMELNPAEYSKMPIATLSTEPLNLGVYKLDQVATGNFRIKNTGLKPLTIYRFETTCSCVQVVELKKSLEAETHCDFPVSVKSMGRKGTLMYQIIIYTNDPVKPKQTYDVLVKFE